MHSAVHSLIPNLPVSPLALPPRALRISRVAAVEDGKHRGTEKRLLSYYLYDTEEKRDAGSTLSAGLCGPKDGVHLRGRIL